MSAQAAAQDGKAAGPVPLEWAVTLAVTVAGRIYGTGLYPSAGVERRGDAVVIDTGTGAWLTLECGPAEVVVEAGYDDVCGLRRVPYGRASSLDELTGIVAGWLFRMGVQA